MRFEEKLALTPALSPQERVKHAQCLGISCSVALNCLMGTHVGGELCIAKPLNVKGVIGVIERTLANSAGSGPVPMTT